MKKQKNKEKNNYIDAEELRNEVIKSQDSGKCTDRLAEMLILLEDNILKRPTFVKKSIQDKEEAKSFCLYRLLKAGIFSFDRSRSDKECFNYFSTACIYNSLNAFKSIDSFKKRYQSYTDDIYGLYRETRRYTLIEKEDI